MTHGSTTLLLSIYFLSIATVNSFSNHLSPRFITSRASLTLRAKSFDSLEKDRPKIPYKTRKVIKEEGDDSWKKVKNSAFSAYDRLSAESENEEEPEKKAPVMTPGGRLMRQYKTTLEEMEESTVFTEPRARSKWENFKNGVYDSLDKISSPNSDESTDIRPISPLERNNKLDPSNIKPFFPGSPPVETKKENPLKRTIDAISSTAEAIQNIPAQVKNTTLAAKASIEATVKTAQALPGEIQKSYENTVEQTTATVEEIQAIPSKVQTSYKKAVDTANTAVETVQSIPSKVQTSYKQTVDTANAAVDTVQSIPDKVQKSYKDTVDTATAAVETVQSIPKNVQNSYKQTVETATNVVNTVKNISNSVSSTAQNIQKTVVSTKKNVEDMNTKVKSFFPDKEEEKKRQLEKGKRISDRVIAMPRDSDAKPKKSNDMKKAGASQAKNEIKEEQKSLIIDDIDPSLGQEVDIALKLAEEALASQKKEKIDSGKNEESTKKKKSLPLFHLLLDIDE